MEDKQKKYLDKVVELLIKGTKIDYYEESILFPFSSIYFSFTPFLYYTLSSPPELLVYYVKNVYGLTDQEIEYVWKEYENIIKDKIENGR